jgi:hypothetical protein
MATPAWVVNDEDEDLFAEASGFDSSPAILEKKRRCQQFVHTKKSSQGLAPLAPSLSSIMQRHSLFIASFIVLHDLKETHTPEQRTLVLTDRTPSKKVLLHTTIAFLLSFRWC